MVTLGRKQRDVDYAAGVVWSIFIYSFFKHFLEPGVTWIQAASSLLRKKLQTFSSLSQCYRGWPFDSENIKFASISAPLPVIANRHASCLAANKILLSPQQFSTLGKPPFCQIWLANEWTRQSCIKGCAKRGAESHMWTPSCMVTWNWQPAHNHPSALGNKRFSINQRNSMEVAEDVWRSWRRGHQHGASVCGGKIKMSRTAQSNRRQKTFAAKPPDSRSNEVPVARMERSHVIWSTGGCSLTRQIIIKWSGPCRHKCCFFSFFFFGTTGNLLAPSARLDSSVSCDLKAKP